MRKSLILALMLLVAYVAWPAWSAWQLRAAIKARDADAIESRVDWRTLRTNLKQTILANLDGENKNTGTGSITKALKNTFGVFVTDQVIDVAVTPQTLVHVLTGRILLKEIAREVPGQRGSSAKEEERASATDPLAPRRLRWAFFESPTRFRIEVADAREPARRVVSVFELQAFRWRLVDVYYRRAA